MKVLNTILLFFLTFLAGTIAIITGYRLYQTSQIPPAKETLPPTSQFSLVNAPSNSIRGTVTSFTGKVTWQSRIATQAAQLITPLPIIEQGETLNTQEDGHAAITFPQIGIVTVSPKTTLNIIQTLPLNFVVEQDNGTATYTKMGTVPISVRSLHLLINQNEGSMDVLVNKDRDRVSITINEGSITVAYNDTDYISHVLTIGVGNVYTFDDETRTGIIVPFD